MTILVLQEVPARFIIESYVLPSELQVGQSITGTALAHNIGTAGADCRIFIHTLWDDQWYGHDPVYRDPCQRIELTIAEGLILMPDQDAIIEIYGMHEDPTGEWQTPDGRIWKQDDMKTH